MSDIYPLPALGPGDPDPRSPVIQAIDDDALLAAPLGAGDDDPKSPRGIWVRGGAREESRSPLAPGDDDPHSPASGTVEASRGPLSPGESVGPNDDDQYLTLTPAPAGPGGTTRGALSAPRIRKPQIANPEPPAPETVED